MRATLAGQTFNIVTENANLHPSVNNPLMKLLINHGLYIRPGAQKKVLEYLAGHSTQLVYGVHKLGWHEHQGRKLFALPQQIFGDAGNVHYQYTPEHISASQNAISASGSLDSWQRQVVAECVGNPVPLFALGAGFAAPLMSLFNVDGGGFHFCGHSSRGKTTILQIAASVWGNASDPAIAPEHSLIQRWNTTANALEGTALAYNDLLLPMDELGTSNIKNFGQAIYQLAGGKGKTAMTASRDMRAQRTWKTLIMSTGEHTIAHEVESTTGTEARTGQLIRFIDVNLDDNIFSVFSATEVANRVTALKDACRQHYGVAAAPYLQYLVQVANSPLLQEWMQHFEYVEAILLDNFQNLQPEQKRAVKRFTLVAVGLKMATEAGCIHIDDETIINTVWYVLDLWLKGFPSVSEAERGVEHLKQFILSNPGRFGDARYPVDTVMV